MYDLDMRLRAGRRVRWSRFPRPAIANRITRTTDLAISNIDSLVVSDRARAVLAAFCSKDLQFIPVTIRNKSGSALREPYWVVNCLRLVDCVDRKRSKLHVIDGRKYYDWVYFVEKKIPESVGMFRVKYDDSHVIVRGDLARAVRAAGLTGVQFMAAGAPWEGSPVE
ncbi:MAG: hypothetical protein AMXMBFR58_35180 [Phycisphaerae bacterium]